MDARIAQGQAADYLTRWKEAESALDRALSSWEIAEGARAAEAAGFARALDVRASQTEEKMRLKDRQLGALSDALDKTSRRLIEAEAQLRVAKEALSQESSRLETVQRRARLLEVDCREAEGRVAALIMEHAGTDQVDLTSSLMMPDAIARRDLGIKTYFEQEVVKLLLATDPREKVLGLTRELCGIKVVESQLLASLAAARRRADVLCAQSCSLKEINQSLENKLQAIRDSRESSSAGASESASSLSAQLSARTSEAFRLQDELLTCQQRLQTRDLRCDELEREKARLEELASRSRVEGEGQVNRLREELSKAHAAQVAILSRDIDVARQRHVDAVRQLRSELQHCAQQAAEEKRAAIDRVTSERPDPADFSALQAEAEQQRAKLQEAEDALRRLQEENGVLLADLKAIERDNMELRDDRDTRGRALEELERTLTSIERAAERAASSTAGRAAVFGTRGTAASAKAGPCGRTSPSPRCGASGAAAGDTAAPNGPGALAELSRQLVQSKMSAADAERRLRLSARSELELRTQLKKRGTFFFFFSVCDLSVDCAFSLLAAFFCICTELLIIRNSISLDLPLIAPPILLLSMPQRSALRSSVASSCRPNSLPSAPAARSPRPPAAATPAPAPLTRPRARVAPPRLALPSPPSPAKSRRSSPSSLAGRLRSSTLR